MRHDSTTQWKCFMQFNQFSVCKPMEPEQLDTKTCFASHKSKDLSLSYLFPAIRFSISSLES